MTLDLGGQERLTDMGLSKFPWAKSRGVGATEILEFILGRQEIA